MINGRLLYPARQAMGEGLAEEHPVDADLVMGVPDSATAAGIGYSRRSGIPYVKDCLRTAMLGAPLLSLTSESGTSALS